MVDSLYSVISEKNSRVAKWLMNYFEREPFWEDLTPVNLKKFNAFLQSKLSPNSVKTYLAELKAVINLYRGEVEIPTQDLKTVLKTKSVKSTHCYLTVEELERIEDLENLRKTQQDIRDMFLLQAWTGCRLSDAMTLTEENINGKMLTYTSQKTQTYAAVPIKPVVEEIIQRVPHILNYNKMTYNRNVRQLCKMAGITEGTMVWKAGKKCVEPKYNLVSSHTARRSFATNLYEAGVEINKISYMMGHSNTAMTERYVCSNMELSDKIVEFFK